MFQRVRREPELGQACRCADLAGEIEQRAGRIATVGDTKADRDPTDRLGCRKGVVGNDVR